MYSLDIWDVSHMLHEERLQAARREFLLRQCLPATPLLQRTRRALGRILHYLF